MKKNLVVYDFDWSLIDDDSDRFLVDSLLPNGEELMMSLHSQKQWTDLLDYMFGLIHEHGHKSEDIKKQISKLPLATEMIRALHHAKNQGNAEIIVLSDANTYFIDELLKAKNVRNLIDDIITNTATFDESGRLRIKRRIGPTDPPHGCTLGICSVNICKGKELDQYIQRKSEFETIIYVGDGRNDFCPSTRLRKQDHVFVRSNRALEKMMKNSNKHQDGYLEFSDGSKVHANIHYWGDAKDVEELFQQIFKI